MVLVPLDDSLLNGPTAGLENISSKLEQIVSARPNAIMGFPGLFMHHTDLLRSVGLVLNVTASTTLSHHTRKVLVATVMDAIALDVEAVAVHVNVTSEYEREMLQNLGAVSSECERSGMPLVAIMYPRTEGPLGDNNYDDIKESDRDKYVGLVAHAARIGVDLGADLIKTRYTGDTESFNRVIEACRPVGVIIAGGPLVPSIEMLKTAYGAIQAGAIGISFGRNIFSRAHAEPYLKALNAIVHEGMTPDQAIKLIPEPPLSIQQ